MKRSEEAKLVNADYGIDMVVAQEQKRKWYRWYKFPLLPLFEYRPGDEWNSPDFQFSWLFLRVWSVMTPYFHLGLNFDDHGLCINLRCFYLNIWVWLIILPDFVYQLSYKYLWRTGSRPK